MKAIMKTLSRIKIFNNNDFAMPKEFSSFSANRNCALQAPIARVSLWM